MCKHETMEIIAQGDEGCWGKETFCLLTGEMCPGAGYCKKYIGNYEEDK